MGDRKQRRKASEKGAGPSLVAQKPFDYDKLAEAIVRAEKQYARDELIEKEKQEQEARRQWKNAIGMKEPPKNISVVVRRIYTFLNNIACFFRLIFFKKENATNDVATLGLLRITLTGTLGLIKWVLYLIALGALVASVYDQTANVFRISLMPLSYAFLAFVFARILRIAEFEIEKMTDRNYLIGILSAITSFVAMLLAIIAIFLR